MLLSSLLLIHYRLSPETFGYNLLFASKMRKKRMKKPVMIDAFGNRISKLPETRANSTVIDNDCILSTVALIAVHQLFTLPKLFIK